MRKIFSLCAIIAVFWVAAFADVRLPPTPNRTPAPKEKKSIESYLTIRIDKDAKEARLLISKNQIKQLRAELEQLDDDSGSAAFLSFSRTQTIVSGLFLSLAFVFGGVWFSRRGKANPKPNKMVAAGAVLFLCGALGTVIYANVGPPIEARSITSKIFNREVMTPYLFASGKIKVETSDDDRFELIVPDKWDEEKK
jgi:hypothetical protein